MKWLWIAAGVIVVLVVAALVVGWLLPEKHTASRHASFQASPETVWALITDVEKFPSWRSDVKTVERLPNRDGRPVWVEEGSNGRITFAVERSDRAPFARRSYRGSRPAFWRHLDLCRVGSIEWQHADDY